MELESRNVAQSNEIDVIEEIEENGEFENTCYSRQALLSNLAVLANWREQSDSVLVERYLGGCAIWDASSQNEVALFLAQHNEAFAVRLLVEILHTEFETSDRLKEISVGILANLFGEASIASALIGNEHLMKLTKRLLFSQDSGTLLEICRMLQAILWNPDREIWRSFYSFPIIERIVFVIACTLDETLCAAMADLLLHMLSLFADEAMMTYLMSELNLIPLLTTVLKERLAEEQSGETFNECDKVIENIVNIFEFLSTHPLAFPAIKFPDLKSTLAKIIQQKDELSMISTACLTLANIETEDSASALYKDANLIKSLVFHFQMYSREDSASSIVALLYELSKNLRLHPDPSAIKAFLDGLSPLLDSLGLVRTEEFVLHFLDNLLYFYTHFSLMPNEANIGLELMAKMENLRRVEK